MGSGSNGEDGNPPLSLPPLMVQLLQNHDIVRLVLSKAEMPAENTVDILKSGSRGQGRMLLKMLRTLRARALLCLNNLVSPLALDDLGGVDGLFQAWVKLGRLCFGEEVGKGEEGDTELHEAATSALRALTQKLAESSCQARMRESLEVEDLNRMVAFGAANGDPGVRVNMVQVVGGVGAMLMAHDDGGKAVPAATTAANFLLEAAARDAHLRVVAEALDKIFDMFAEDWTDALAAKVSLLQRLKGMQAGLKAKMGMQRQSVGEEHYSMAVMAKTNLVRFIKYKEKRLKNGH